MTAIGPEDGAAWITGGSSGIGAALARRLAAQGWRVAISARSGDDLNAVAADSGGHIRPFPLDVTDADAAAETVARIEAETGPLALAVLSAGVFIPVKGEAPDAADFAKTFRVNLEGAANCLAPLVPRMRGRRKGRLVIVSSATAFGGMPTAAAYGASKAGLLNMAECLQIELKPFGLEVQVVTPGFVKTPMQDKNSFPRPFMISAEDAAARLAKGIDSGRFEISFPRRLTWTLKALYALPRAWRLPLIRRATGWTTPGGPYADEGGA